MLIASRQLHRAFNESRRLRSNAAARGSTHGAHELARLGVAVRPTSHERAVQHLKTSGRRGWRRRPEPLSSAQFGGWAQLAGSKISRRQTTLQAKWLATRGRDTTDPRKCRREA
eukprot:scaffold1830_cov246-Pinguiococcus_pyrenoidosus.AAC.11